MNTLSALLPGQNPPPPVQGPEYGGSSPIGLVVTLLLLIALIFLIRSMNKHLKKVPPSFDPPGEHRPEGEAEPGKPTGPAEGETERGGAPEASPGGALTEPEPPAQSGKTRPS